MTGTALSGGLTNDESKPPRVSARRSGVCLDEERMSDSATARLESGDTTEREQRAEKESFEFSIPSDGKVRVQNKTHEDDEEHEYVVAVEDSEAIWCVCPDNKYRSERCKHMIAVENEAAIMAAASASAREIEHARESGTGAETIRRELGVVAANAMGVEDERVVMIDVSEIGTDYGTVVQIEREMPEPRDGSRTTVTEYASECVIGGCNHVEIAQSKSDLRNRLRGHARDEHHDDNRTRAGGQA